jgi:hypothetical protein
MLDFHYINNRPPFMKYTIILLSFLLPRVVFSQFATIQDKNGFVLVRSNPSQAANIKDTLFTNDLYFRFGLRDPAKPDWVQVDYFKGNGKHKGAGFIQESQMKPLSAFDSLARVKNEPKQVVFKKDLITVSVQAADFAMKTACLQISYTRKRGGFRTSCRPLS